MENLECTGSAISDRCSNSRDNEHEMRDGSASMNLRAGIVENHQNVVSLMKPHITDCYERKEQALSIHPQDGSTNPPSNQTNIKKLP